jgi:cytochrome c oxidase assembly protein subunit 11
VTQPTASRDKSSRLGLTAAVCVVFVAGMVGMSFAAVPLYRVFCQVTGFGGTTQQAAGAPSRTLDRQITVRFDGNVGNGLGWNFRPRQRQITLPVGEVAEVAYVAENRTRTATTGTATFNVTPPSVGAYFNKIACFCFTEQSLAAGETLDMPVQFFVDPAIADDPELDHITTITLSYTFFPAKPATDRPLAAAVTERSGGSL